MIISGIAEMKKLAKPVAKARNFETLNMSLDVFSNSLISSLSTSPILLVKPNQKSFQMVRDMMDFRSYSTSSNEVIVRIKLIN